jgi:outer membrane receptor for ferrienterochelin and colicins
MWNWNESKGLKRYGWLLLVSVLHQGQMSAWGAGLEPVHDLDRMVVTATRTEQPLRQAPGSVGLISREQMDLVGSADLLGVVRDLSGLTLQGQSVGGRKVALLRGMEARHTLILVDGRRVSATDAIVGHSDFQYDWVPTSAIERVEVVRGPMSALYGSEAMGGVINIITRPVTSDWTGELVAFGGLREDGRGGDEWSGQVNVAGPLGAGLGIRLSALHKQVAATPLAADERISELEGKELSGVNAQLTWALNDDHRFEFLASKVIEDRWMDTNSRGRPPYYRSGYDLDRQLLGARWLPQFGDWTGRVGLYEARTDVEGYRNDGGRPTTPQYMRDWVGEADISGKLGTRHHLTLGGEWRNEELIHRAFSAGKGDVAQWALYAQNQWQISGQLSFTGALRLDEHDTFGSETSPRAYMVWDSGTGWVVKGGYGAGFKAPTLKQSSPEYRFDGHHVFVGNADVGPETSDSWELSVLYERDHKLSASLTAFRNNVDDLIAIQLLEIEPGPRGRRVSTYVNVDRARIDGLEAEVVWRPLERLRLQLSYTWLDALDISNDRPLPDRPEHRLTASLQAEIVKDVLSGYLSATYTGQQLELTGTAGEAAALPSYTMANAHLRWQLTEAHTLTFGIFNIGDVDLIAKAPQYGYAEPGRSYSLRWMMTF